MSSTENNGMSAETSATDRQEILSGVAAEMVYWKAAPARFFKAWQEGVSLAGVCYFGDGTQAGLQAATNKNDLAPNFERILGALGYLSGGERTFLVAMYSFYNDRDAQILQEGFSHEGRSFGGTISGLDLGRRRVLAELTLSYTGW